MEAMGLVQVVDKNPVLDPIFKIEAMRNALRSEICMSSQKYNIGLNYR